MLCENCKKKEANIHYTEIYNNKTREMHYCSICAEKKGIVNIDFTEKQFNISSLISGFVNTEKILLKTEENKKCCKYCGLSYEDFREIGRLGCSGCYESFSKELIPLIRRIHGRTQHIGKVPEYKKAEVFRRKELLDLKRKLKKLIVEEKYEDAAAARDQINLLEKVEK
ncbi:MAG: UvrB/UvrC motif-containing protein [bacterium]|nr:UvrB/UvrC motif-containing protein [bacterium]